jgi:hypothetical protein
MKRGPAIPALHMHSGAIFLMLYTIGPCVAKDIPVAPGQLLCHDKALALSYLQTSTTLTPNQQFRCVPVTPGTTLTEVRTVAPNIHGKRLIEIVAQYPGYAPHRRIYLCHRASTGP